MSPTSDAAPSTELRQWFHAHPDAFAEFARRYRAELDAGPAAGQLRELAREHRTITLLYSVRDADRNHARVLAEHLDPAS